MKYRITATISAAFLATALASGAAVAQQAEVPAQQAAPATTEYSDSQLQKFVNASKQVAAISSEYTPKLQAADDQQEQQEIYREADEKMVEAVQNEGMSVDEFNGINQAVQADPQLMERVQNMAR